MTSSRKFAKCEKIWDPKLFYTYLFTFNEEIVFSIYAFPKLGLTVPVVNFCGKIIHELFSNRSLKKN